jgi:hypothetical protein
MANAERFLLDGFIQPSWHAYGAIVLIALGLAIVIWSLRRGAGTARRRVRDPGRALALVQGFRIGIIGLSLAGIGAAWLWQLEPLLVLSLIIGGEELLESSVVIAALKRVPTG